MDITTLLEVESRGELRAWFEENHDSQDEIWIVYFRKHADGESLDYDTAVEEALCFGWIDSTMKSVDDDRYAQRFTPRREGSSISELNKERIRRLIDAGRMKKHGLDALTDEDVEDIKHPAELEIASDILAELQKDETVWENFRAFPDYYKRIRIAYIETGRDRTYPDGRDMFRVRLNHFIEKTREDKRFGSLP